MKIRTAKLYEDPLKNLIIPPQEKQGCFVISEISQEEYVAVIEFIKNAGFGHRLINENEIVIFPAKDLLKRIENLESILELI